MAPKYTELATATIDNIKLNKDNHLLYAVPYQHFTNSIEFYFSMLKSRLQKLDTKYSKRKIQKHN
jgi:hypothetical protein